MAECLCALVSHTAGIGLKPGLWHKRNTSCHVCPIQTDIVIQLLYSNSDKLIPQAIRRKEACHL